jgi:hypothetical protein
MPLFDYQCGCGLCFERRGKVTKAMAPRECPSCREMARRVPPSGIAFTFSPEHTHNGPVPQNTGISSVDYDADRIVGKDARKRYAVYEKRDQRRREVLAQHPGRSKKDLSVLPDGDVRVMSSEEKQTVRNTRAFNNLALGLSKSEERYRLLQGIQEQVR